MPRSNKPKSANHNLTPKPLTETFYVSVGISGSYHLTVELPIKFNGSRRLDEAAEVAETRLGEVLEKLNTFAQENGWNLFLGQSQRIDITVDE